MAREIQATVTLEEDAHALLADRLEAAGTTIDDRLQELLDDHVRLQESLDRYVRGDQSGIPPGAAVGDRRSGFAEVPPPIGVLLGFSGFEAGAGRASIELPVGSRHANPMGTLHGGVLCDLGDAAMGAAYATTLAEEESFASLELDVKFLRPVWGGTLRAEATIVKEGRTVGLAECDVHDGDGRHVARLQSLLMTLRGERAAGR